MGGLRSALTLLDGRNQLVEPTVRSLPQRLRDTRQVLADPFGQKTVMWEDRFGATALVIHVLFQPPPQPAFEFESGYDPFPHPGFFGRSETRQLAQASRTNLPLLCGNAPAPLSRMLFPG
jgi:hypothetical protein